MKKEYQGFVFSVSRQFGEKQVNILMVFLLLKTYKESMKDIRDDSQESGTFSQYLQGGQLANIKTYIPQLLYSSVIVYVIEFYSIHCTKSHFNTVFVCSVVREESPGCRLFGTASMLEWSRNRSTDTYSPRQLLTKQMKKWTLAHQ